MPAAVLSWLALGGELESVLLMSELGGPTGYQAHAFDATSSISLCGRKILAECQHPHILRNDHACSTCMFALYKRIAK